MQRLVSDGIAASVPRRGVHVLEIDFQSALDLLDILLPLSGIAARYAAEHASPEDVERLAEILERQEAAAAAGDTAGYAQSDAEFHTAIARMSKNEQVEYFLNILHNQLRLVSRLMFFSGDVLSASLKDHRAVFRAIRAQDPQRSEKALMQHVRRSKARMRASNSSRANGLGR